jgi:predicted dehydrogenase
MKTRWGIISTADIGVNKVIPAIQNAKNCEVIAISSRDEALARKKAKELNIPCAYGSYEDMLADKNIDVVYNPLPNHLHVPYSIKAMEAGKHVLCEKPIAMNASEAQLLAETASKYPTLKVMEAFMYRFHPQWKKIKELIAEGALGELRTIHSHFSFYNTDPANTRNIPEYGGGALYDIGCYCISFPRFLFDRNPVRVISLIERDQKMKIDCLSSAMLDFGEGKTATFTCSIQLMYGQWCEIMGTKGRIVADIPVNAPNDRPTTIMLTTNSGSVLFTFEAIDQYTLQAEEFANAIINKSTVPTPLTDAIANLKVIDALFESEKNNSWIKL